MLFPSVLAILIPVLGGFIFGVDFVGGLLIGATIVAIPRAIFMGNSAERSIMRKNTSNPELLRDTAKERRRINQRLPAILSAIHARMSSVLHLISL
jgi:hypothetical protein